MWLVEQVELLASSICPPRSPAVASHATVTMLTTLCFLLSRKSGPATSSGCWTYCCCRNSQRSGRRKEWDAADKWKSPRRLGGGAQVKSSADAAGQEKGGGWPGQTTTGRSRRKDKYNASSGKENEGQTPDREPRGKLLDVLLDHPPRASSCRDNMQKPVAPRRQGSWTFEHFEQLCHPRSFESSSFRWQ